MKDLENDSETPWYLYVQQFRTSMLYVQVHSIVLVSKLDKTNEKNRVLIQRSRIVKIIQCIAYISVCFSECVTENLKFPTITADLLLLHVKHELAIAKVFA